MPYYRPIKDIKPKATRLRTIAGLKRLTAQLDAEMPGKTRDQSLILGTWNIRNFDDNRFGNGQRTAEDLQYLAEIIARFDVLAIQEICDDLAPLDQLMHRLGRHQYDYIVTDVTEGSGGNQERLGFIYDRSKVAFKGVAGELVLPDRLQIIDGERKRQFSRTPFMCSFQAGWFKFLFSTVHIYFGSSSGSKYRRRVSEIESVARFLKKRADDDDQNHVLVGDFNIIKPGSQGYSALAKNGFTIHQNRTGSNKDQTKFYDQIAFRPRDGEVELVDSPRNKGVLQFFDSIYREEDFSSFRRDLVKTLNVKIAALRADIAALEAGIAKTSSARLKASKRKKIDKANAEIAKWEATIGDDGDGDDGEDGALKDYYMRDWRTFRGSDHLPLWVELEIDFSDEYLDYLKTR